MKKESKAQSLLDMLRELISSDSDNQMSKREAVARFTYATGSTINLLASDLGLYVRSFASVKKDNDKIFNVCNFAYISFLVNLKKIYFNPGDKY